MKFNASSKELADGKWGIFDLSKLFVRFYCDYPVKIKNSDIEVDE